MKHFIEFSKAVDQQAAHEQALFDQYVAWKRNGTKPKLIVGKKYRMRYPELYVKTNPAAEGWDPNKSQLRTKEFVPKDRSKK